jgi:hypothetical protein
MQSEHGTGIALTPQLERAQSTELLDQGKEFSIPRRELIDLAYPS